MSHAARTHCALGLLLVCSCSALSCGGSEEWKDRVFGQSETAANPVAHAGTSGGATKPSKPAADAGDLSCIPAESSDQLRPRESVVAARGTRGNTSAPLIFTRDLFSLFRSNCGGCHVDQSQGGLHVDVNSFATKVTIEALHRIMSDDPAYFMPPPAGGGMKFSKRDKGDPVVELAALLEAWLAAGRPADAFSPATAADAQSSKVSYQLEPSVAMQMTNLGNCVPDKRMVGMDESNGADLDAKFETYENSTDLPDRLEETDLMTLDSQPLARDGVVAFAPAYTLWADDAKKVRMIRVPRGQSIVFDKRKQTFTIPANTRFYKTFFKRVLDLKGNESYRKMETRLIVSRPDEVHPDGSRTFTALFGTYAWNEQESEAVLVRDPLRNGQPFRDRTVTYVTDEQAADAIIASGPVDSLGRPTDLQKALDAAGISRTYAIPGSERCIQCHMGAPDANFILGFTPLQINRRPEGEGGVIEPAGRDELNQLQRLIDYGVITGMTSPDDVLPLEQSQGKRAPRNDHELQAQGYMLGNCSHCHNPHGFPSVTAPELRDVLDFLPSAKGGIFQFPLEKFSPRILRGPNLESQIPYVTPSLYDLGQDATVWGGGVGSVPTFGVRLSSKGIAVSSEPVSKSYLGYGSQRFFPLLAPWRSLIYRNVDAPFSYAEDYAIFPHMPRNTPGYDCRARQLLGTWMTSIPAREKVADKTELALEVQPFKEVMPDDRGYEQARNIAQSRANLFKATLRYRDCPDSSMDVVDPRIRDNPEGTPAPPPHIVGSVEGTSRVWYELATPERPHWFVSDMTDAPGDWEPRRADWKDILIAKNDPAKYRPAERALVEQITVGPDGNGIRVSGNQELHDYALTDIPFALWREKAECTFPSVRRVRDIAQADRPAWMAKEPRATAEAHVYSVSPGAQVFKSICQNCHGPEANAKSRLADTIADLTGGATRVANLRDGLLGPTTSPGANRQRVFGEAAVNGLTTDDWAARYVTWMALGGTQRLIPDSVLGLVGSTYVAGEKRSRGEAGALDANMLQLAKEICIEVLPNRVNRADRTGQPEPRFNHFDAVTGTIDILHDAADATSVAEHRWRDTRLITWNGDAEMWQRLCALQNPLPVRVVRPKVDLDDATVVWLELPLDPGKAAITNNSDASQILVPATPEKHWLFRRTPTAGSSAGGTPYGAGPVGDHLGRVRQGLDATNLAPWCILRPSPTPVLENPESLATLAQFEAYWTAVRTPQHGAAGEPPYCPDAWLNSEANRWTPDEVGAWIARGAMNAGLSAFLYLDALQKDEKRKVPEYDRCEELERK